MSRYFVIGVSLMALLLAACSGIKVATIPPPPSTAKVRIYVEAVSTIIGSKGRWGISAEDFSDKQIRNIERILQQSGIFEVVNDDDVGAVLGEQQPTRWDLEQNNWALAHRITDALHADYALIVERGKGKNSGSFFETVLINAATGKRFGVSLQFFNRAKGEGAWPSGTPTVAYRELFKDAKGDLLNTAVRKSMLPTSTPPGTTRTKRAEKEKSLALKEKESIERKRAETVDDTKTTVSVKDQKTETGSRIINMDDQDSGLFETVPAGTGERLVVYDLEAAENLKPTALILSECLREELFKFRRFSLVNRENLLQLMDELKFHQSGFVDEKQAVQLGKGMAANQVVTGRLGPLGGSYLLQAKRIDVQSLGTRALGSLKCKQGEEELLLEQLPALAKKLAEAP